MDLPPAVTVSAGAMSVVSGYRHAGAVPLLARSGAIKLLYVEMWWDDVQTVLVAG